MGSEHPSGFGVENVGSILVMGNFHWHYIVVTPGNTCNAGQLLERCTARTSDTFVVRVYIVATDVDLMTISHKSKHHVGKTFFGAFCTCQPGPGGGRRVVRRFLTRPQKAEHH